VPQEMIALTDTSWTEGGSSNPENRTPRPVSNRVARKIKAAFPSVVLYRSSFISGGNGITWSSNAPHAIVRFRDPILEAREQPVTSRRLSDQLIAAQHFISVPIMKRHDLAGVTGAFKNNFGTIASCKYFHENQWNGRGAMQKTDGNPAVDIWLNPHVGAKTRLIVCDGIFAGWNWGNDPPTGWKSFGGRSPNCLLLGTDPVAMDSVVFDHVTESLPEKVKDYPPPNMLVDAERLGLGVHESRTNPAAGYKNIDYAEIDQEFDHAKLEKVKALRTKYRSGGKTQQEIRALLEECRRAL
jgi:hypothetical protein